MSIENEKHYASLTHSAVQIRWKTPTEFPACPAVATEDGLKVYADQLAFGSAFADNTYSTSIVVDFRLTEAGLVVLTRFVEESIKDWAVAHVSIRDGAFHHRSERTFFELKGALKHFCALTGERYDEGSDDYM